MSELIELETKQEELSSNGWKNFASNADFLQHIGAKEPAEELVEVPEWNVKVLCKALDGEGRVMVETQAYNPETRRANYSKVAHLFVRYGAYNPVNDTQVFTDDHIPMLKDPRNGGAVARLFLVIFRLSRVFGEDIEHTKKN